jgi:hypothetical protein
MYDHVSGSTGCEYEHLTSVYAGLVETLSLVQEDELQLRLLQAMRILLLHNYTVLSCSNITTSRACLKRMHFATTKQSLWPYKRGVALKE